MQDEYGINFTDPFILSDIEIARKEEKSSQTKKEKSSSQKTQARQKCFDEFPLLQASYNGLFVVCNNGFN